MDQERIGKFIAKLRKENNITQTQLANKLGITDRAVSKWENGRGMPDLSLIRPLSKELNITVNELLCGERLTKKDYSDKLEENIIDTLEYSGNKIKEVNKTFNVLKLVIAIIILTISTIITIFYIDVNLMRNNRPVFFSTWGFDYTAPLAFPESQIKVAIEEYLITKNEQEHSNLPGEKWFVEFKTYLIEEKSEIKYNVYTWVLEESYYLKSNNLQNRNASSRACMFVLEKKDDKFMVITEKSPRDGSLYKNDMEEIFPYYVRMDMSKAYSDGTIETLQSEIDKQVRLYFHD